MGSWQEQMGGTAPWPPTSGKADHSVLLGPTGPQDPRDRRRLGRNGTHMEKGQVKRGQTTGRGVVKAAGLCGQKGQFGERAWQGGGTGQGNRLSEQTGSHRGRGVGVVVQSL